MEGGLKSQNLEAKHEAKLEFPGGEEGIKQKVFRRGGIDTLWNCTLLLPPAFLCNLTCHCIAMPEILCFSSMNP